MSNRFTQAVVLLAAAAIPMALMARSAGPPTKRTGAAVDGGLSCIACHRTDPSVNYDTRGRFSVKTGAYTPGVKQVIMVALQHPEASRWGFQMTARLASDETKTAGTFTVSSEVRVRCAPDERDAPCNGDLEFASHQLASTNPGVTGWSTWRVEWTPPAQEAGDVVFYAAGNAANNSGTNAGDHVYTTKTRIYSATGCNLTGRPTISGIRNAASYEPGLAINSMMTIFGAGFLPTGENRVAAAEDLVDDSFPKQLACVAVEVAGKRAPLTFVRNNQINAQVPSTNDLGPVEVKVILNPGMPNEIKSESVRDAPMQLYSPAFFTFAGSGGIAATDAAGNILADTTVVPSGKSAKPGDIVVLYGTGFGVTNPFYASGDRAAGQAPLRDSYTVTIGGVALQSEDILYAGLAPQSISGLYQFNVRVPASAADGNIPVSIRMGSYETQKGTTIPIKK